MAWISPYDPAVSGVTNGLDAAASPLLPTGVLVLTSPFLPAPSYQLLVNTTTGGALLG